MEMFTLVFFEGMDYASIADFFFPMKCNTLVLKKMQGEYLF